MARQANRVAAEIALNIATQKLAKAYEELCYNDRQLGGLVRKKKHLMKMVMC